MKIKYGREMLNWGRLLDTDLRGYDPAHSVWEDLEEIRSLWWHGVYRRGLIAFWVTHCLLMIILILLNWL